jgi:hypothetical protein
MLKNTQKLLFSLALVALFPSASFGIAVDPECYFNAGYYCDSSNNGILCPSGSYCPSYSYSKNSCPDGTTSDAGASWEGDCYAVSVASNPVKCVAMGTSSSCTHTPATEYQTDWGSECSGVTVRGVSMCGNYESVSGLSAGSVVETVWRNHNASDNRACLCKIVQPVASRWVYAETYYDENGDSGASRCSRYCALSCAGKIADTTSNKKFHDNILGVLYE